MISIRDNFKLKDLEILNFVNLSGAEKEMIRRWRNCDDVREYMRQGHIISPLEHRGFIRQLKKNKHNFYWVVKQARGEYLGVISLNNLDVVNKNAYLGIYANPHSSLSGKGSALMECLKYISFKKARLHTLHLEVFDDNRRAVSFYKRSGFLAQGRLREFIAKKGRWKDLLLMGMINRK